KKQEYFYRRYKNGGNKAAKPGRSNHQNGIALDIANTKSGTSIVYQWLKENATKYGFVRTVKSESWHWVYLPGKAKILREKGDYRTWKI
ncbi:MAG: M15 family metallopeptidase, partial [Bacteroidota bacterium]